jgi:alkanesulfonate monooxygenase SsuD/methylene tetrahydromethanopterin reductase-like flavin-dependent oxidoreductase (luciferase family)
LLNVFLSDIRQVPKNIRLWSPPWAVGATARRQTPNPPDFARDQFIIGDKASVKEEIVRYRELLGVDHFIMRCQWPGLPQEQVLSSIQRLGEIFAS